MLTHAQSPESRDTAEILFKQNSANMKTCGKPLKSVTVLPRILSNCGYEKGGKSPTRDDPGSIVQIILSRYCFDQLCPQF